MSENYLTRVDMTEDLTGPPGLITDAYEIPGTNVIVRTSPINTLVRKDPWRSTVASLPILLAPSFGWACEVGNSDTTEIILDAMGDPGKGEEDAGVRTWVVGRADDVRRFHLHAQPVEGGHLRVNGAALASAQLVVERGRIATWITDWVGRGIKDTDPELEPEILNNSEFATSATTTVLIRDESLRVFSGALQIGRMIKAANYDQDSVPTIWTGNLAFDLVGRFALRLDTEEFVELMTGEPLELDIEITMTAGSRVRTINIPRCAVEARERRLVGPGMYEHIIDFAAIREPGEHLLTATSQDV